jgi:hypothetical protein
MAFLLVNASKTGVAGFYRSRRTLRTLLGSASKRRYYGIITQSSRVSGTVISALGTAYLARQPNPLVRSSGSISSRPDLRLKAVRFESLARTSALDDLILHLSYPIAMAPVLYIILIAVTADLLGFLCDLVSAQLVETLELVERASTRI